MGREVVVAITDGRLDFGPWEQIFWASRNRWHASLDGRRRKRVLVKIIGDLQVLGAAARWTPSPMKRL
jgi:thiamine phosphate synthase YjbQ (UPF0047 family)